MSNTEPELLLELTADTSKFAADMRHAARAVERFARAFSGAIFEELGVMPTGVPPYGGRWTRWQMVGVRSGDL